MPWLELDMRIGSFSEAQGIQFVIPRKDDPGDETGEVDFHPWPEECYRGEGGVGGVLQARGLVCPVRSRCKSRVICRMSCIDLI